MRWIKFLRALLGFVYFFAWISAVASLTYLFIASRELGFSFNVGGNLIKNLHWTFYIVMILAIVSQFIFVFMIYQMKKASWLVSPNNIASSKLGNHLKMAGLACITGALLNRVPSYIFNVFTRSQLDDSLRSDLSLNFGFSFDSMLVIISFGIFLIITSQIIKVTAILKQENDLTI